MTTTRHADAARRLCAFVQQTMSGRGLRCLRPDVEVALVELTPEQLRQVHDAAMALAKGADDRSQMNLLAGLRSVSARPARQALSSAGILYRADVLLPLAAGDRTGPAFARDLALLQNQTTPPVERDDARTALLALCGPLNHDDLIADAEFAAPPMARPSGSTNTESALAGHESISSSSHVREEPVPGTLRTTSTEPLRRQAKVFGKTAALTWETAPMRGRSADAPPLTTVMIEGAAARGDGSFDWDTKVVFACTARELPQLLAVLMGWVSEIEFGFHSGDPRKKLSIAHQAHGIFVKLQGAGATHGVPVDDADRFALAMLVLHAMVANDPLRDAQAVMAVCHDVMSPPRCLAQADKPEAPVIRSNSAAR